MAPGGIELIDLRTEISDAGERKALCEAFFEGVYRAAFPKPDQSESPEIWLPLLEGVPAPPHPLLHIVVARRAGGEMVGGVVVEYFRASHSALVTYIAVAPEGRGQGLARRLLGEAVRHVTSDNDGSPPRIFGEVERPEAQSTDDARRTAEARLAVISALGGRRLDFDYIQPSLGPGKPPATDLMLVLLSGDAGEENMPADELRFFIDEFFASLDQFESPERHRVLRSLRGERVALEDVLLP